MAVVDEKSWLVICTSNDGRVLAPRIGSLVNDVVVEHDPQKLGCAASDVRSGFLRGTEHEILGGGRKGELSVVRLLLT